ncbi:hypothetical protein [Paenibacillus piscarius]|uniref:hypothetical protein n=1 Tax=Paenibacillus piscarius TaxID=1089681 RepID=UPI001EE8383C|nr:hypothetical protein [Paenibacillus piscarius]
MQMHEAAVLRQRWDGKSCSHPYVVSEYLRGTKTGDYVCTACGEVGWGKNWPAEEAQIKSEDNKNADRI